VVSFLTMWDCGITMKGLILSYPNDLAQVVQLTTEELSAHLRLMAALEMFELSKLSSRKAAELASLSRAEFFAVCGRYRVSLFTFLAQGPNQAAVWDIEDEELLAAVRKHLDDWKQSHASVA
jgi:hypothetical protein